jgi:hypothetical protein
MSLCKEAMQASFLSARAVDSQPGLATNPLFQKGKAFLSEAKSDRCIIYAHRFLSGPPGPPVYTCSRSPEEEAADQRAVAFDPQEGRPDFCSQDIQNESHLGDFLRDRWSRYERPAQASRSSYVLYGE